MILKILLRENPSNIWELIYLAQMCGANKLNGRRVLILLREDWISLFGRATFIYTKLHEKNHVITY